MDNKGQLLSCPFVILNIVTILFLEIKDLKYFEGGRTIEDKYTKEIQDARINYHYWTIYSNTSR